MNKKKWIDIANNLYKILLSKKILFIILIIFIIIVSFAIVFWNNWNNNTDKKIEQNISKEKNKKIYEHEFPERVFKNDYFKWEFISNDIASIYPRREAIVRDVLVDIWDRVKAWDTLAILLNPWVWWEWQSKIDLKNTLLKSKNNLLEEQKKVKESKINEITQKIEEKEIILEETIKNFDDKISQIWNTTNTWSEYQVYMKSLENLKINLQNARSSKQNILNESYNKITQKEELLDLKIEEVFNKIIPILYIWNSDNFSYWEITSSYISTEFWAKDSSSKNKLISEIKEFNNVYEDLDLNTKYKKLLEINNLFILVLKNTITSSYISESSIQSYISDINWFNNLLVSYKQQIDDSKNQYSILESNQNEKIENLESQILQKENELKLLLTRWKTLTWEKELTIKKIKSEIETLKKSKESIIANENRTIVDLENQINISKSELNNEYIKSWNYKIISPFSWVISKRSIKVWEKIGPNIEAFRVSWVETTLSRITKKEIKFYVPENLKDNLELNDEIYFSPWNDKDKSFTGTIYRISPEIDEKTLNIIVQAKVDDDITLPNKSTLRVNLETKKDIFKIPSKTIYNKWERKIIYYKKDNWKIWVKDINIVSDDWEYSLVTWEFDENLKVVTTPIFIK